jgi:hypothetical protein
MNGADRLPRALRDNLVIRQLDDETLVYDTERDEAHCLNHSAALVWELCDGKTTPAQAARILQSKLNSKVDSDFVWLAVKQLQKFYLVERNAKSPSVSRRDLVLKYAPAALALLPVVYSISAPEPASAASCATSGQSCMTMPCCPGLGLACQPGSPPVCRPT